MDILQVVFMDTGLGSISTWAEKAVKYSKEHECAVLLRFNDILLDVTPWTSVESVVAQYHSAHALRRYGVTEV